LRDGGPQLRRYRAVDRAQRPPDRPERRPRESDCRRPGETPFEKYAESTIVGTPEEIRERAQPKIDLGFNYFIMSFPRVADDQETMTRFATAE